MPKAHPDRIEEFCQRYAGSLQAAESARQVGFTSRYGYELLTKEHVRARIEAIQSGQARALVISQRNILREAAYIAGSDITEVLAATSVEDLRLMPERIRRAIRKVKRRRQTVGDTVTESLEIEMHTKQPALELLARATGAMNPETPDDQLPAFAGLSIEVDTTATKGAGNERKDTTD